jgi:hypothetical protein
VAIGVDGLQLVVVSYAKLIVLLDNKGQVWFEGPKSLPRWDEQNLLYQ